VVVAVPEDFVVEIEIGRDVISMLFELRLNVQEAKKYATSSIPHFKKKIMVLKN
jgi:hypothetical protein